MLRACLSDKSFKAVRKIQSSWRPRPRYPDCRPHSCRRGVFCGTFV